VQAWLLQSSPGDYTRGEIDPGPPGPGRVSVRVVASALNHMDLWLRLGMPKPRVLPMVPGCDAAGVVEAVGTGVSSWAPGDEVVVNPSFACGGCARCLADKSVHCPEWGIMGEHYPGAHAESVVVPAANLVRRPPGLSWEEAASYGLCGLTAYRMLERARLRSGERLLVVGAGGGVGAMAVALGARMGAEVLATSRSASKRQRALELGAREALPTGEDLRLQADVVVDSAGSATWQGSVRALAPGGRLVLCGATGGGRVELNLPRLFFSQHEVIGSTMGTFRQFAELTAMVADGLPVVVDSVHAWSRYPEALARLEAAEQFGKVVLSHSDLAAGRS
jgi:NADPH:quinone reductase-like Zn-dependent oxidoreductase